MPSAVLETVPELLSLCVAKRRTRPTQKAKPSFRLAVEIYSIPIMPPKCNRTSVREKCNEVSFSHLTAGIVATVWASLAGLTFDNVAVFFRILGSRFWERKLLATGTDTCRFRRLLCFAGCDWFILTRASASLFLFCSLRPFASCFVFDSSECSQSVRLDLLFYFACSPFPTPNGRSAISCYPPPCVPHSVPHAVGFVFLFP